MFNFDGREGAIGRVPKYLRKRFNIRLIQFDVETEQPIRGPNGLCLEAGPGQIGECIGKIGHEARAEFAGYVDKAASEKKVLRDVFEKGDAWFATGDLMKSDADGYFYFIDRIGDTFRWKGENVSTGEVAERLQATPGVKEANVYGVAVAGAEGRAGMAGLVVDADFDIAQFGQRVAEGPARLRPAAVRAHPARHRDHRHLQDPQGRPDRRRLRPRQDQGPALFPGREARLCEDHQGALRKAVGRPREGLNAAAAARPANAVSQGAPCPSTRWR